MHREDYEKAIRHLSGYCAAKLKKERGGAFFESTRSRIDEEEDSVCASIAAITSYVKRLEGERGDLERVLIEDAEGDELTGREEEAEKHRGDLGGILGDKGERVPEPGCSNCDAEFTDDVDIVETKHGSFCSWSCSEEYEQSRGIEEEPESDEGMVREGDVKVSKAARKELDKLVADAMRAAEQATSGAVDRETAEEAVEQLQEALRALPDEHRMSRWNVRLKHDKVNDDYYVSGGNEVADWLYDLDEQDKRDAKPEPAKTSNAKPEPAKTSDAKADESCAPCAAAKAAAQQMNS